MSVFKRANRNKQVLGKGYSPVEYETEFVTMA